MSRDRRARVYMHAARWQKLLNYNGRGDVRRARANAALGAVINYVYVRTYVYLYAALALRAGK